MNKSVKIILMIVEFFVGIALVLFFGWLWVLTKGFDNSFGNMPLNRYIISSVGFLIGTILIGIGIRTFILLKKSR